MSRKRTIARNVFWNWMGTLCDAAVAFAVAPFLVSQLGASVYGIWILIGSMSGYFGLLDLGVRSSVGRYVAFYYGEENHKAVNDILSTAFAATCLLGLVVLAATPLVNTIFFHAFDVSPEIAQPARTALTLIIVNLALTFPLSLFDGTLWGHQRFDLLNMVDIPASITRATLTFWLVSHGYGLVGLAMMTLAISTTAGLTKALLSFRINRRLRIAPRYVTREMGRHLLDYSGAMFAITIARMTRLQFTPLLIGWLLSPVAVTIYSIPKRLLDYTEKLFAAATGVLTPLSASLQARKDEVGQQQIMIRGGRATIALSALFLAFYLAMGRPFITLWMGPTWASAYDLLVILALGECIPLSQMTAWNMLLATAKHKVQAIFQAADVVLAASLAFALLGSGVTGLTTAIAVSGAVFRGLAVLVHGCRVTNVRLSRYVAEAVIPGLLTPALPIALLVAATAIAPPNSWPYFLAYCVVYGMLAALASLTAVGVRPVDLLSKLRAMLGFQAPLSGVKTAVVSHRSTRSSTPESCFIKEKLQIKGVAVSADTTVKGRTYPHFSACRTLRAAMSLRTRVRSRLLRTTFDFAGINIGRTVLAPKYAGNGVIFMLHRVLANNAPMIYPGYEITVDGLDSALHLVKLSGWDIVSIDEMCRRMREGDPRRFACFTFDDGYLDNYTLALPVFTKYDAPMCVYISTGALDRSMSYWWGALTELILSNDEIEVPFPDSSSRTFELRTLQQKRRAYDILDTECHAHAAFMPYMMSAFDRYRIDPCRLLDEHALSIRQARQFASHPLVTIGSHAVTHCRLSSLSDADANNEISNSRKILEKSLDVAVRHIAYPYGGTDACGQREFALAQAAGYVSGVTTQRGNILREHRDKAWMLPRHALSEDRATVRNCLFGTQTLLHAY